MSRPPSRHIHHLLTLEDSAFEAEEFSFLWLLALGTYGVGDIVTTVALIKYSPTVNEANLLIRAATRLMGTWGFVGLKLVVFLAVIAIAMYGAHTRDRVLYYLPPIALTIAGTFVTVFNIRLMLG